jgi:hypothetical protein
LTLNGLNNSGWEAGIRTLKWLIEGKKASCECVLVAIGPE